MITSRRTFLRQFGLAAGSALFLPRAFADKPTIFTRSTPAAEGVDAAGIHAFLDAAEKAGMELHSFMLVRHGRVVAEGWWAPYERGFRHTLYSLSKSFTSTAIGLLAADGKLNVEEKVAAIFPELLPAAPSANLSAMRVKDLLTMSAGHAKDPTFELVKSRDWQRDFLAWPVEYPPGAQFVYNSGATYMLSAIVQQRTGRTLLEFLQERLFGPLGISGATWETCPHGICTGGWGLSVTTESIARFAQLYLQKGMWNGRQFLPESWIAEATSKQVQQPIPEKPARPVEKDDWKQGYGYQFWRSRHGAYRGDGAFGQLAVVMPEQDAVLAVTAEVGNMQAELDLVWEHILPALKNGPLPSKPDDSLKARLASLALPIPANSAQPSPALLDGRTIQFEQNALGIESLRVWFGADACNLVFNEGKNEHAITAGLGRWKQGETALPGTPPRLVSGGGTPGVLQPVSVAAAWTGATRLSVTLRFHETPHHDVLTLALDGANAELSFKTSIVSLNPKGRDSRPPLKGKVL